MTHQQPAALGVVASIRQAILDGGQRPGTRLDEVSLGAEHGVSRNTLREAFRLLAHDRLVEHHPHRGVFVRTVTTDEAHDIYAARRMLEIGALRDAATRRAERPDAAEVAADLERLERTVADGEAARAAADWSAVGTHNGAFHVALTALAHNAVIDRLIETLIIEMRLLFLSVGTPFEVHDRYLDENRRIVELVRAGELARAAIALETYLLAAERHLVGP